MPRGRLSNTGSGTGNSSATPDTVVGQRARLPPSGSSRGLANAAQTSDDGDGAPGSSIAPPPKRPRGRPTRASLLAGGASSRTASVNSADALSFTGRPRGRPARASIAGTESVSSVPTPLEGSSESGYSTPDTSKVPTPVAADQPKSQNAIFEVRLPSRAHQQGLDPERELRNSIYSLNAKSRRRKLEVGDSDDEDDDLSDVSPDVKVARRLQEEEYAKADKAPIPPLSSARRSGRVAAAATAASSSFSPAPTSAKRGRAPTITVGSVGRPSKKSKVVPDSEDLPDSDIDMDAEVAAGVAFENQKGTISEEDDLSFADSEDIGSAPGYVDDDEESDEYSSGEDEFAPPPSPPPKRINKAKSTGSLAAKGKAPAKPPKKSVPQRRVSAPSRPPANDTDAESLEGSLLGTEASTSALSSLEPSASDSNSSDMANMVRMASRRRNFRRSGNKRRLKSERDRLETHHPEITTMWMDLEQMPVVKAGKADQPPTISRQLKPFQLEGLAWMTAMEKLEWKGGLLGDEMGLGKTIQAVSLIMSDYPAKQPSLVLVPPVALMQWQSEINAYTDGTLRTFVFHGTNQKAKGITVKELKAYDVIMMSYNSLESMYRKQEKGFKRKDGIYQEKSVIHSIHFHRVILDEAHCIKTRTTMTAKACFALNTDYRWCLTGTPLQNRIGEFFSLIRFLNVRPFASYLCKQCPCTALEWNMDADQRCRDCDHFSMQHVSVFNQELLNPIQKFGNLGPGREAFRKLRLMTERIMLRRLKKDHTNAMELPVKEVHVDRQFFGEEENDFANSIMTNGQRKFDTYVAQGVLLNNYANIFGLIMQMRQVADHPDLILKKNAEGGQNILVCCICDEPSEDTIRSRCKHDFCRTCVSSYVRSTDEPDCPRCHIPLAIDLEQVEIEQDENLVKKNSIINRIKMENWTSSSKIELLVHDLHKLRSDNASHKSIIFSQFTTMLQLIEWRLRRAGITTVMLDGSMTPAQRQASIEHFMTKVDVECFLVSLKAGGVALNLTEASRVFIVDPWWNPAAEWQSADRCHRIGQTRPCTITRLCIEDSVESRMVLIQEKKTNMINSTVNADDKAMESLSPEDMQFLFRGS